MDPAQAAVAYTTLVLVAAGLLDLVYREIDPELWLVALPPAIPLGGYLAYNYGFEGVPWWTPYVLNMVVVVLMAAMYVLGYVGGADVGAVLLVAVGLPVLPGSLLPTLYVAIVYSVPFTAAYYAWKLYTVCGLKCVVRGRALLKGEEAARIDWIQPRDLGEALLDAHELVARADAWDREVYATPLFPTVFLIAVGLLVTIIVGDTPIWNLLGGAR